MIEETLFLLYSWLGEHGPCFSMDSMKRYYEKVTLEYGLRGPWSSVRREIYFLVQNGFLVRFRVTGFKNSIVRFCMKTKEVEVMVYEQ